VPELPEVEVLRRSLLPLVVGRRIESIQVWNPALREPVRPRQLARLKDTRIIGARRRAKYLWLDVDKGWTLVIHLGMSGRLTLVPGDAEHELHEHVGFYLDNGQRLRFRDSRRFGLVLAQATDRLRLDRHFAHLWLEPLEDGFSGAALGRLARGRKQPVKNFIMDGRVVVGVGNIYAAEALHRARIHPRRSVGRISAESWDRLAVAVRQTLADAIGQGGTTLNDFADATGESGYFKISLAVYDRADESCPRCGARIRRLVQSGRSTFYCPGCQR